MHDTARTAPYPRCQGSKWALLGALLLFCFTGLDSYAACTQQEKKPAQEAGGVQPAESRIRPTRSISGSKGTVQNGQFVIDDPRTIFYVPDDQKVIVYFEWEGPPGQHHFEGLWKDPEGKVVVISNFNYEAQHNRFAGYWTLLLSETISTGLWTLEARVDGEVTGTHAFQIIASPRPDSALPTRRRLAPSEIYQRALTATLSIKKYGPSRKQLSTGSGFHLGDGLILTAFQVIEGATSLRVVTPDGQELETDSVIAWNRWQDWALLKTNLSGVPHLERAESDSWAVGDRCFTLDVPLRGNRVITEGSIVGKNRFHRAGERLNVTFSLKRDAVGSPVLNSYGEVIGIAVRGGTLPGLASLRYNENTYSAGYPSNLFQFKEAHLVLIVPISVVPEQHNPAGATRLAQLSASNQFAPPSGYPQQHCHRNHSPSFGKNRPPKAPL